LILQNWAYSFFGRRSGELEGMLIWRLKRLDYIARYEEYIAILLQYRQVFQETKGKANQNHATRSAHKALEEVESVLLDTFDTPEEWEISRGYRQKATVEYQKRVAEHLLAFAKPKLEPKTGDEQVAQLRDLLLDAAFWPFHNEENVDVLIGWYKKRGMILLGLVEEGDLNAVVPDDQSVAEETAQSGSVEGEVNCPSPPPSQVDTGRSVWPLSVADQLSHVSEHLKLLALLKAAMGEKAYEVHIARHSGSAGLATVSDQEKDLRALADAATTLMKPTGCATSSTDTVEDRARQQAAESLLNLRMRGTQRSGTMTASSIDEPTVTFGAQSHHNSNRIAE
jgi:hypothetical protein